MPRVISLAGNPNSGKTTMFNYLTGSSQRVGNWPGVTVECKDGRYKLDKEVTVQDLPGIYSLSPYTLEEVVARDFLINSHPDVIINIVDASNIERNLYLTTQLTELGIPVVIALNMIDVVRKKGDRVELQKLGEFFGCPVVEVSALRGEGCDRAVETALELVEKQKEFVQLHRFSGETEKVIAGIAALIAGKVPAGRERWYAVKLFERDEKVLAALALEEETAAKISDITAAYEKAEDDCSESIIARERYDFIEKVVAACVTKANAKALSVSDKIDRVLTGRYFALPVFALAMFMIYYLSITTIGTMATDWVNDVFFGEWIYNSVSNYLSNAGTAPWLQSLLVDGILNGVGAVIGFLPQMLVLFLCLAILEDCGYMARVAFIMDRIFRNFGLSGKSFIPMLISTGCGVPGIMASRTIENENDRRMTVITATFIPCGAKLPIIALISGALFNDAAWVATSTYFAGIAAVVISGIILKKTPMFAGEVSPFIMELPAYHLPLVKSVLRTTLERGWSFVKKAATVILLSTVVIWFLQNFNWKLEMVDTNASMLASLGGVAAHLFVPLGWGDWRATVAMITGLIAKENVVGTLGVLYGMDGAAENGNEFWAVLRANYTPLAAYSFLIFNLLCAPCVAAIGAVRREMMSARWTLFAIGYQTAFAFISSLFIYQFGSWVERGWHWSLIPVIVLFVLVLYLIFRKNPHHGKGKGINAVAALGNRELDK